MQFFSPRRILLIVIAVFLLGGGIFLALKNRPEPLPVQIEEPKESFSVEVIGTSVLGRKIEAYKYGDGEKHLVFVGGIHGGYEWNSVLLSYKFMDYLEENPDVIPDNVSVSVIPSANPDGLYKVIGKEGRFNVLDVPTAPLPAGTGRFNANDVDLNRNFDCKWKPESMWRGNVVSAGVAPFSEPEAAAIRDFMLENTPEAVIFWHSQSNAIYASECYAGILPETRDVMNAYSLSSGYPAVDSFDAYPITGDVEGWLASINIPAITVELQTHETIEWERNLAGIKALFGYYR